LSLYVENRDRIEEVSTARGNQYTTAPSATNHQSSEFKTTIPLAWFEGSPLAQLVILADPPTFTMLAASDAYLKLSNVKREDLLGRGIIEVFPANPKDPASGVTHLCESLQRVISTREPDRLSSQRYDVARPQDDDVAFEERYWNARNAPILGADGDVEYILHSVEEITEKVIAEREAQQANRELQLTRQSPAYLSEQRLRRAQRAGGVGSFEWLLKEHVAICTPELEALYGLAEGAFQAGFENWKRHVVGEDAERVVAGIEDCMRRGIPDCVYEFRVILPDGRVRWLRGQARFFYDECGAPERMIGVNIDIDAQKQAEAALRKSEQRLRAIYDGTYQYIALLWPDGTLLEANRPLLEFAANTHDELVGRPFWETPWFLATPGAPEQVRTATCRAAAGEFVRFEVTLRRPSGECPTFDISFHPIRSESGEVALIVREGRDITDHKEFQEQLRQQWQLFDTALSHTPDHIYIFDSQGRVTYANRALLARWQRTLGQASGNNLFELGYPQPVAERLHRQLQQVVETRQPLQDRAAVEVTTGEIRHYEYIFVPVFAEDGSVEAVAGSTRDVTDRERMEKALAESERKLQRVFAQAPVAIAVFRGEDFIVEIANPSYRTLLPDRDLVGRRLADIIPELGQNVWEALRHVFDTGEPFIANEWYVPYDSNKDGITEDHWFNVAYNPLCETGDMTSGLIAVLTDVTAQVLARKELERVNLELEEFSYVASHDLQAPLRTVNIYAQLLLKGFAAGDEKMSRYAAYVQQGVQRMETLLKDLLTFSRTVHSEALPIGTADLSLSLAEAVKMLGDQIEESGAVITSGSLPSVRGDTQQMAHVFQNLLSNALKYRKKELPPEINIWAEKQDREWAVAVQDNGIGFEPKYAERIFGLFKRLHGEEYPGTGMGLAICQRIIQRYGGRMWAEGRLGEGATLRFSLPAQ